MIDFKLYVITDRERCAPKPLHTVVLEILDAGVKAIQLREKDLDIKSFFRLALPISALCNTYNAQLFINTNVQVAIDVDAAGVHLPDNETSINQVKAQANKDILIGCSTHNIETARKREREGADFVVYSPIYPTLSKPDYAQMVGIENLKRLADSVHIPVFALGGITPERVNECLAAGASGISVMSGIMRPKCAAQRSKAYLSELETNASL